MPILLSNNQLEYLKNKFDSDTLTVSEISSEFQNGKITSGLYAYYMDKLGAEDQVTDPKAKKYFQSIGVPEFPAYVITPYDYSKDPD